MSKYGGWTSCRFYMAVQDWFYKAVMLGMSAGKIRKGGKTPILEEWVGVRIMKGFKYSGGLIDFSFGQMLTNL